jgi:hypothetical protein
MLFQADDNHYGVQPFLQACSKHTPPITVPAPTTPVRLNFVLAKN